MHITKILITDQDEVHKGKMDCMRRWNKIFTCNYHFDAAKISVVHINIIQSIYAYITIPAFLRLSFTSDPQYLDELVSLILGTLAYIRR